MNAYVKLTPKQGRFVEEYLVDLNATQAAIRAGYSKKTAQPASARLLSNVMVAAAIAEAMRTRSERTEITQDMVVRQLARIAFSDPRRLFTDSHRLKPITALDEGDAACIAGLDVTEEFEGRGEDREQVGWTKKLRLADKIRALELLGRHLAMFTDNVRVDDMRNLSEEEIDARLAELDRKAGAPGVTH